MKRTIRPLVSIAIFWSCAQAQAASTTLVIAELRTKGPNGSNDEFVEIKNISAGTIDISGYKLKRSAGSTITMLATVPAGTLIPANGHYLFTRARNEGGMAYSGTTAGNQIFLDAIGDTNGVAITLPDDTVIDAVGFGSTATFKEGTQISNSGSGEHSYERKPAGTNTTDTDDNASDFVLNSGSSNPQNSSRIAGVVFDDRNRNGVQDAGEPPLENVRVYLDADENNAFNVGETNVLTDANGAYAFLDLSTVQPRVAVDLGTAPTGFELISPTKPLKRLGRYNAGTHLNGDVWGEGNLAAMGSYDGSVLPTEFIDITDPANPTLRYSWTEPAPAPAPGPTSSSTGRPSIKPLHDGGANGDEFEDVVIKNNVAFVSSNGTLGIHILDLEPVLEEPPEGPAVLAHIDSGNGGSDKVHTLSLYGNLLLFADNATPKVWVFDVGDFVNGRPLPETPAATLVRTIDIQAGAAGVRVHEVTARNGRMYVAVNEGKNEESGSGANVKETEVWDISQITDAGNPVTFLGHANSGYNTHTVWGAKDDGSLVISAREPYPWEGAVGEVTLWDFSNPANPWKLSTLNATALGLGDVSTHIPFNVGNTLYVSWYWAGVMVFDISDPAHPVMVGRFDTTSSTASFNGCWGVYPYLPSGVILACDIQNGLFTLQHGLPGGHYVDLNVTPSQAGVNFALAENPYVKINPVPPVTVPEDGQVQINLDAVVIGAAAPSHQWSLVSNSGYLAFGTPTAEDTTATLSRACVYEVKIHVDDGPKSAEATRTFCVDDRFEPNDLPSEATPIARRPYQNLACCDDDWYSFDLPDGETVIIKVVFSHALGDLDIELRQAGTLMKLTEGISATNNEKVTHTNSTGSTQSLLLRVIGKNGAQNHYAMYMKWGGPFLVPPHDNDLAIERISATAGGDFIERVTQMAFGPDGKLYVAKDDGKIYRFAYDPAQPLGAKEQVFDIAANGLGSKLTGIAFHGTTMYVSQNKNGSTDDGGGAVSDNFGAIVRLEDNDGDGVFGEAGPPAEAFVAIARDIPIGDHQVNNLVIVGNTLYAGIGTRSSNGSGDKGWSRGESSYNGTVCWIEDLTDVLSTDNAAGLFADPTDLNAGDPYTNTAANKLRVHSSGTRNPYGIAKDGNDQVWITVNERRSGPNDALDDDFTDDRYDAMFRVAEKADYGYDNGNWRSNPLATGAGYFQAPNLLTSFTHDNLNPAFVLHDPANPVGLGPHSSANGFAIYTSGVFPPKYHRRAFVSRFGNPWANGAFLPEAEKGFRILRYSDVVSVDLANGAVERIVDGLNTPLDVVQDPFGNLLISDFLKFDADVLPGGIYRIKAQNPDTDHTHDFVWNTDASGSWTETLKWLPQAVPNQWGAQIYNVTIDRAAADPNVALDLDAAIHNLTLQDKLEIPANRKLTQTGDYTQGAGATLHARIAGTGAGQVGCVHVAGQATLNGTLEVTLEGGLDPLVTDEFEVLTYGSRSGSFSSLLVNNLPGGKAMVIEYEANRAIVRLNREPVKESGPTATPNPTTLQP